MRNLDLFDKLGDASLQLSTRHGKIASSLFLFVAAFLVIIQAVNMTRPDIYRDLVTDTTIIDDQEKINISLTVLLSMPCYFFHIDVMDSVGHRELDLNSTVEFRRVDRGGRVIDRARQTLRDRCRPCYGLLPEGECCDTCEMLVGLAKKQKKPVEIEKWEQCGGVPVRKGTGLVGEKCLIKGKITIYRIAGSFHIAPGRNRENLRGHGHELPALIPMFDMSHKVERVRFGPNIPTARQPLKNVQVRAGQGHLVHSRYNMIATSVIYKKDGKIVDRGYEYQEMHQHYTLRAPWMGVPGLFFTYSFSPYTVLVHATTKSPFLMVTTTVSILSGMFAILSLLEMRATEGAK